jgi:hypothetical protein
MFRHQTARFLLIALSFMLSTIFLNAPAAHAQSCPVNFNTTGSIAAGDPTQTGRVTRDGVPSDCNGKAYPGPNDLNAGRRYDAYTFTNTNATAACINVTFTGTIAGLESVAYLNSYNPADISQNYIGDLGVIYAANTTASYSFSVPAGATFVVVVHETTANGPANSYTLTVGCTTAPPPFPTPGQVLISEFRLAGPGTGGTGSARDEFIELYNNTDTTLTIGGLRLQAFDPNFFDVDDGADFTQLLPAGATIPARGRYLVGDNGGYSLASYAALNFDTGAVFAGDFFIDNEGIQLVNANATVVIDSVGFSGSGGRVGEDVVYAEGTPLTRRTQTPPTDQYAYVRNYDLMTGRPVDTNNNASDFSLVSVTGTPLAAAAGGTVTPVLGAPGPQDLASPTAKPNQQLTSSLVEPTQPSTASPNRVRDGAVVTNGPQGTLSIRRRFTNNTGAAVTALRFRVIDITTLNSPNPGGAQADMRAVTSGNVTIPTTTVGVTTVQGTTLDQPPTQPGGGGLNSSLSVTLPGGGLTSTSGGVCPGGSTCTANVQFLLGVNAPGRFRFFVDVEALP